MSRAGDLLLRLRVHAGYRRSRPGFIQKYDLWSVDVQRAFEDGTTLMKEEDVLRMVECGLFAKDTDNYLRFMEAVSQDIKSRDLYATQRDARLHANPELSRDTYLSIRSNKPADNDIAAVLERIDAQLELFNKQLEGLEDSLDILGQRFSRLEVRVGGLTDKAARGTPISPPKPSPPEPTPEPKPTPPAETRPPFSLDDK